METIRNLITALRRAGILLVIGIILIGYIALGVMWWQLENQQTNLEKQIAKAAPVLARPLPSIAPLQAETDNINTALAKWADEYTAIGLLVSIAEKNGINIDESAGKLNIPPPSRGAARVGGNTFQLLTFSNIHVQGNNDNVTALLTDLDSGKTLETMVLKRVVISQVEIPFTAEEIEQRGEFGFISSAVKAMMEDNRITLIPNPLSYALGRATNFMGDNPETETVEGFPDPTTVKYYTGNSTPRNGYLLYQHDKISTDNTTLFETKNYFPNLKTKYYYTSDDNGVIRQFDGPIVAIAKEYLNSGKPKTETIANVDVVIYIKR